jgi:tetratricopeptide (TPR) repeat protein
MEAKYLVCTNSRYVMKRTLLVAAGALLGSALFAQTLDEAKSHLYYNRYNSAADVLGKVVQANPSDGAAWYWLSVAQAERKKPSELRSAIASVPADRANDPWFAVAYGNLLLQEGKADSAAQYFGRALDKTREKDADLLLAVARAHIDAPQGNNTYALQLLDKAIKRDKRNPALYMARGDAYRNLKQGSEAYKAYADALEQNDKYVPALFALGRIFTTQKNPDMYLQYFDKALAADPRYAPALYQLYLHYYYTDVNKAMEYFTRYAASTEVDPRNDYLYTDLVYLSKQYDKAIQHARQLLQKNGDKEPRLYKLIAYSYQGLKDSAQALTYMSQYFAKAPDSVHVVMDYQTMGELYASRPGSEDSAAHYFEKAIALQTDTLARFDLYKTLSNLYATKKDYHGQAQWLGRFYTGNTKANNLDLFNWGLAHYRAQEYAASDSVFARYAAQYPEQAFGHYWRARSSSVMDKDMTQGLAVPHYQKVIEIAGQDTANETNRKWLVEAYAYLAAYETNTKKNYAEAINYFQKLLVLDPQNADAAKYIKVLEKNLGKEKATATAG